MKAIWIGLAVGLLGCGSSDVGTSLTCNVAPTDNVAYQDCNGLKKNGIYCVSDCGRLPQDGGAGTLLSPGCMVQIGTSSPLTAVCVDSCSECN